MIEVTTTVHLPPTSSAGLNGRNVHKEKSGLGLSGGAIAGIVVGVVCGLALIAAVLGFLIYRKRHEEPDDEDFFDVGKEKPMEAAPNPFMTGGHAHNNSNLTRLYLNNTDEAFNYEPAGEFGGHHYNDLLQPPEEFGRRRLSNGLLPDMTRNTGLLKVVNT